MYVDSRSPLYAKFNLFANHSKIIYFDITSMVVNDNNAGIGRAMKIILQLLTKKYSASFLIIPVYFYRGYCYCSYAYAKKFNNTKLLDLIKSDLYIEHLAPNSIFLRIDINFAISKSKRLATWFMEQKKKGVVCVQIIHDLIPISHPKLSEEVYAFEFEEEITAASLYFDLSICVSRNTMNEYGKWLNMAARGSKMKIDWLHWGYDIDKYNSHYTEKNIEVKLDNIYGEYFLMVSTIEPKKGYDIVIEAFDYLWHAGYTKSLVIVGKEGFKTTKLIQKIKSHPLCNKKLFWLDYGVSDRELTFLYENARAFIMASMIEGFGMGVVEAAKYQKPLILRDIPVFREIASDNAYYFSATKGKDLANEILHWEDLYKNNLYPSSDAFKLTTWEECCDRLMKIITDYVNDKKLH